MEAFILPYLQHPHFKAKGKAPSFYFTTGFLVINQSRWSAATQQIMPEHTNYSNPWKEDT